MQDNWKVTSKLSLDYGMRFTHHGPQYDIEAAGVELLPGQVVGEQAPLLYEPGCATAPSRRAARVAWP